MRIGDLPAERRKRDRGEDEERSIASEDLEAGVRPAEAEENEHHQHIADEIVVERREELAPEQRREAPRRHEGAKHEGRRPSTALARDGTPKSRGASSRRRSRWSREPPRPTGEGQGVKGALLQHVANADQQLLRRVALPDRHAGLGVDQLVDRAAVEVAIADIERRARIELKAEPGRQREGQGVGRSR